MRIFKKVSAFLTGTIFALTALASTVFAAPGDTQSEVDWEKGVVRAVGLGAGKSGEKRVGTMVTAHQRAADGKADARHAACGDEMREVAGLPRALYSVVKRGGGLFRKAGKRLEILDGQPENIPRRGDTDRRLSRRARQLPRGHDGQPVDGEQPAASEIGDSLRQLLGASVVRAKELHLLILGNIGNPRFETAELFFIGAPASGEQQSCCKDKEYKLFHRFGR